jgi:hypothetical protein
MGKIKKKLYYPRFISHFVALVSCLLYTMYFSSGEYPQRGVPHETFLEQVQITSLASRRKLASIKFLSDLFNCSVDCPYLLSQFSIRVPSFSCRKHGTFYLDTARTNLLQYSSLYIRWLRITLMWRES